VAERSADRLRRAEADLRHARNSRDAGDHDWSAFAAHQAAEKALKALFQKLHLEARGHTLSVLLSNLPSGRRGDDALLGRAKGLDYTRDEAERAIADAEAILEFCRREIGR